MSKFKVGDRIVRVACGASYAPLGYEAVVLFGNKYIDVYGKEVTIAGCQWELAEDTSKYHKHHDLIIQWAKGAEIEYLDYQGDWEDASTPSWSKRMEYRIKPTPPKTKYRARPLVTKTDKERIAELEARVKELEENQ
jgi:hypothetical protein